MKHKAEPPLSRQASSRLSILLFSFVSGFVAFTAAIWLQWLVYDEWLHWNGPLRLTGSVLAGILTFAFALRWQFAVRRRKIEMLHRFERIAQMNDRIRNALQVIECVTYATNPQATAPVRDAVDVIEGVLHEVLSESRPAHPDEPLSSTSPESIPKAG
jgi:thiol:disulfide interchange protein